MPGTSTVEVKCEKCSHVYESTVIDHISLAEDPDLAKSLRTGKINRVQCPKCKKVSYIERTVVVNFEPQSIIVVYAPTATTPEAVSEIQSDYDSVTSFNETLQEIRAETEFKVVTDAEKLKELIDEHLKTYG
ncbi:MAG: hypothetical protein HXY34_10585 [Candidatus Thorarchaeota archaeon]|nr:hypothetical protein [Candidatus Thorarchaeota archaeon]